MENFKEFFEEEHERKKRQFKIISEKGLDIDNYLYTRKNAECVATALGKKEVNSSTGSTIFRYCDYNLLIIHTDRNDIEIKVLFNGTVVLDDTKYFPGKWEEIVEILCKNILPILKERKQKEQTEKNILFLASRIKGNIGEINIGEHILLKKFYIQDIKDEYMQSGIVVLVNGEKVFEKVGSGYNYAGISLDSNPLYVPGEWENEISQYRNKIEYKEYNDFISKNDSLMEENIKKLRKRFQ
ncbi:MAG: hypothetical protein IKG27_04705 [Bacilli bacterium]|nr:hypothetical protein [Bacilli bacterium]